MVDKRIQIMESAMTLFAGKGYHATSIQDIADLMGIAKGSVYSYFRSKQDLLMSILKFYSSRVEVRLLEIAQRNDVSVREKMIIQIVAILEDVEENRHFILMLIREHSFKDIGDDVHDFLSEMEIRSRVQYARFFEEMYGEGLRPHLLDCVMIYEGIFHAYLKVFLSQQFQLNPSKVATYMMDRMDDVARGLITKSVDPVLPEQLLLEIERKMKLSETELLESLLLYIAAYRESLLASASTSAFPFDDQLSSLQVLEEELRQSKPRKIVVKGMTEMLKAGEYTTQTALFDRLNQWLDEEDRRASRD